MVRQVIDAAYEIRGCGWRAVKRQLAEDVMSAPQLH